MAHQQARPGWQVDAAAVQVVQDAATVDKLLNAQSLPIRLPASANSTQLQRFAALAVDLVECPVSASAAPDDDAQQQPGAAAEASPGDPEEQPATVEATFALDSVLFAGGPVWALDWCPHASPADAAAGPLHTVETLAVATHPRSARRNPVNAAQQGPGVVQLWGVPSSAECQLIPGGLPKLLALLWHDGRLAWDVQWCPQPSGFITASSNRVGAADSSSSSGGVVPLQGLLAAALANGDIVVWGVPTVRYLLDLAEQQQQQQGDPQQQQGQQQEGEQQAPQGLSLRLPYVWQLQASAVGGSLCSCCRWLPSYPHDKLLVGCWDGNAVIWQLSVGAQGGTSAAPVQMFAADTAPIRAVAWQPNQRWWFTGTPEQVEAAKQQQQQPGTPGSAAGPSISSSSSGSSCSTQLFITASSNGNIKVWDVHDVLQACQERMVTRYAVNAALWLGPPHAWLTASADGIVRCFWVDPGVQATGMATITADVSGSCGNVWGLSASLPMAVVAYVADGGLLGLMPLEPATGDARHRKSHAALSAMAVDEHQLWLLTPREIPGNGGLYPTKEQLPGVPSNPVVVDPLPHPDQVLYAVAFSPNYRGLAMLAAGGGAGVVRLHTVSADVVPLGR